MQGEVHRVHGQRRILGEPRLRSFAKQHVLERPAVELQAGVDAFDVSVQFDSRNLVRRRNGRLRPGPQPVHAHRAVGLDRGSAQQRGQLARCTTAQQVHLKETLLAVQKAECSHRVRRIRREDARHSLAVALDRDCACEARDDDLAVERGQRSTHGGPQPQQPRDREQDHNQSNDLEGTSHV